MNGSPSADGGDLRSLLAMLGRRAWVVALAVVVGVAAALVFSASQPKRYEATAKLLFRPTLLDYAVSGVTLQVPNQDQQRVTDTNLGLLALEQVRQRAAARLPGYTTKRIKDEVDITQSGQSDIVSIKASASTAEQAARVADAVALAFVTYQRATLRDQVVAAAQKVRTNLKQPSLPAQTRTALRTTLERLNLLASVQTGGVEIAQHAEAPSHPASPKPVLNSILGGALGLVLGLGIALAAEQLDRRVRRVDQLEGALGVPVLASVPRSRILRRRTDFTSDGADAEEPFRRLRAGLRQGNGDQPRSVLVTSAKKGSGKTTVAIHLAAAFAAGGFGRVLLIEADLRRPRLAAMLDLPRDRGLSQVLHGTEVSPAASEHTFRIPVGGGTNGSAPGGPHALGFDALPAGPSPDQPSEMLASQAMRELLRHARTEYELIVVEAPPPTMVSDAIPLLEQIDGVLVVGRLGYETGPELRALRDELARFHTTAVGAVANFSRRPDAY